MYLQPRYLQKTQNVTFKLTETPHTENLLFTQIIKHYAYALIAWMNTVGVQESLRYNLFTYGEGELKFYKREVEEIK